MQPPDGPRRGPDDPTPPVPSPRRGADLPIYGRAAVPGADRSLREPTAQMPVVASRAALGSPARPGSGRRMGASRKAGVVSWQKASRQSRRRLFDGWGFTAAGLIMLFCGWGLWAVAGRGTVRAPALGLGLVVAVAALIFVASRAVGYVALELMLRRTRWHARWAHGVTGLFLAAVAVWYVAHTSWIMTAWHWLAGYWPRG